jgi:hypothetical protein
VVTRVARALGAIVLCAGAASCADVWGLHDLTTADGGSSEDGSSGGGSSGGGSSGGGSSGSGSGGGGDDGGGSRVRPPADGGPVTSDAGTCAPDITVSCGSNPGLSGFSCTGSATPEQSFTGLTCGAGQSGAGGATDYCCYGNWCGEVGDPKDDGQACSDCYMQYCVATLCACDADSTLDGQGYAQCSDYVACVAGQCQGGQQYCEGQCMGSYSSTVLTKGNAELDCISYYCAQPCNAGP